MLISPTLTGYDLAEILKNKYGTFVCRQGAQVYTTTSTRGHSISSGPTPLGPPIAGVQASLNPEPWFVNQISDQDLSADQGSQQNFEAQSRSR